MYVFLLSMLKWTAREATCTTWMPTCTKKKIIEHCIASWLASQRGSRLRSLPDPRVLDVSAILKCANCWSYSRLNGCRCAWSMGDWTDGTVASLTDASVFWWAPQCNGPTVDGFVCSWVRRTIQFLQGLNISSIEWVNHLPTINPRTLLLFTGWTICLIWPMA